MERDKLIPKWFAKSDIPYAQLWPDDRHWFPLLLAGKYFRGEFHFTQGDILQEHAVREVSPREVA